MRQYARHDDPGRARAKIMSAVCAATVTFALGNRAAEADTDTIETPISFYGTPGLLDMPGAHMSPDGELRFSLSNTNIQRRFDLTFQATPWLEGSFRYFSTKDIFGQHPYYDRSFGVKIRLQDEIAGWPDISIGALDIVGTSLEAGEYLVASKHFGPFDVTLGMGWGRLAGTGMLRNPFGYIADRFKTRQFVGGISSAGQIQFGQFLRGPDASLYGGVAWQTPIDHLSLIGEYSSDNYHFEFKNGSSFQPKTQFNAGAMYQLTSWLQISAAWMYGSLAAVQLSLANQPGAAMTGPRLGARPLPPNIRSEQALDQINRAEQMASEPNVISIEFQGTQMIALTSGDVIRDADCSTFSELAREARRRGFHELVVSDVDDADGAVKFCSPADDTDATDERIASLIAKASTIVPASNAELAKARGRIVALGTAQALEIQSIGFHGREVEIAFANTHYRTESEAYGRLARILLNTAPDGIETFRLISMQGNMPAREVVLSRGALERTLIALGTGAELLPFTTMDDNASALPPGAFRTISYPRFDWSLQPEFLQSLFDPDQPYRFDLLAGISGGVEVFPGLRLDAHLQVNIIDTFSNLRRSDSLLPHVRSDFSKYFDKGKNGIEQLQTSYEATLFPGVFAQVRAGYLEDMFAGAGGEILWRPEGSRMAIGVSAYEVWQRGFDRLFDLQKYHVFTGHLSVYYELPFYDLNLRMSTGRYLAGDNGVTFQMTRFFDTGVEIGAFATFTNVPFAKFGEGSFDKGIIIHIPLDSAVPVNSQSQLSLTLRPLTRDGGQMLNGEQSLYDETRRTSYGQVLQNFDEVVSP